MAPQPRQSGRFAPFASPREADTPGVPCPQPESEPPPIAPAAAAGDAATQRKRRNRDPLAVNCYDARYAAETSAQCYLTSYRARAEPDGREVRRRFTRAREANLAARAGIFICVETGDVEEYCAAGTMTAALTYARRAAIFFFFTLEMNSPPKSMWNGQNGIIAQLRRRLSIPVGSSALVRKVLEDVLQAEAEDREYDPDWNRHRAGRPVAIAKDSEEAEIIADAMEHGLGIAAAAHAVNILRVQVNVLNGWGEGHELALAKVSWHAVQGFIERSPTFDLHKRETKKSGKDDKGARANRSRAMTRAQ